MIHTTVDGRTDVSCSYAQLNFSFNLERNAIWCAKVMLPANLVDICNVCDLNAYYRITGFVERADARRK